MQIITVATQLYINEWPIMQFMLTHLYAIKRRIIYFQNKR